MKVYSCDRDWESMLTCIYEAWASGAGHQNIRLEIEPLDQISLFDEYIHVDRDEEKAIKVIDAINKKISPWVYSELAYSSMACEEDVLDNIYRVLILGFAYGSEVLNMVQFKDIMRHNEIRKRVGSEAHKFREFLRFHEVRKSLYVAHIEPKSWLVAALGPSFEDRMPSEHWMIIDDVHRQAVVHPKNEHFYITNLTEQEYEILIQTERENDEYTDLWKVFFETIAIEERANEKCQTNLMPKWVRKHSVEFIN